MNYKNIIIGFISCFSLPILAADTNNTLNIYKNISQHISIQKYNEVENIIFSLPNTYQKNTFNFILNQQNNFINYKQFNISENNESFSDFIENIVVFENELTGKSEIYTLKDISGRFFILQDNETDKITVKNINNITNFKFPEYNYKDKIKFANILLNKEYNSIKMKANYLFQGLSWKPKYHTFIDFENNFGYFNYNIYIENNTEKSFNNTNINLFPHTLDFFETVQPQKIRNRLHFSEQSKMVVEELGNNIDKSYEIGKEVLNLNEKYEIPANQKTTIPYKTNVKFNFQPTYTFFTSTKDNETNYIFPDLTLVLHRKDNDSFIFSLPLGKNYIYNRNTDNLLKINNINITDEDNLKLNIGESRIITSHINKKVIYSTKNNFNNLEKVIRSIKNNKIIDMPEIFISKNNITFSNKKDYNKNSKVVFKFKDYILNENVDYKKVINSFFKKLNNYNLHYDNEYQYKKQVKDIFINYFKPYFIEQVIINDVNKEHNILTINLQL
tara:strand:+ start:35425 stop:36927 length:1503 start_codon:yes stop_codon:yes gene_type:complete